MPKACCMNNGFSFSICVSINGKCRSEAFGQACSDAEAALELAHSMAGKADLICATGSLFIVAEVTEASSKSGNGDTAF
jgi:folylpolyglutamate synthase/dihydropteroate synthase